ncbi:MAG: hypothetical protein WCA77_10280 [Thermoplasmata archaeon]
MDRESPSAPIARLMADLGDWRGDRIVEVRRRMRTADAEMVEEGKRIGTPT